MRLRDERSTRLLRTQERYQEAVSISGIISQATGFLRYAAKLWSLPQIPGYRIFWVRCNGMVEILVSVAPPSMTKYREARKALEPTSYPRLQDFLGTLQSFEAYLRFQATGFSGFVAKL